MCAGIGAGMPDSTLYFEDVEMGDEVGPIERSVTTDQVREFVQVWGAQSGPSRFTDPAVAKAEGLPGAILPGAMNIALMSQIMTGWSPSVVLRKLDVVFRQTVPHNAVLKLQGIVTDKGVVDGRPQLECDVLMEDAEGTRLVIGKATVTLPTRG